MNRFAIADLRLPICDCRFAIADLRLPICGSLPKSNRQSPIGNLETKSDEFKLNNSYRRFYARKLVYDYPEEFEGFFKLRALAGVIRRKR
jgi:hypothetical protein